MASREDCIRLAAFIDGEGCISIDATNALNTLKTKGYRLCVKVSNTDPRLPYWCQKIFGGSVKVENRNSGNRSLYSWVVYRGTAADILKQCMPFFLLKVEQAEVAFRFIATILPAHIKLPEGLPRETIELRESLRHELWVLKGSRNCGINFSVTV